MGGVDVSKYTHSPVHMAVATQDHEELRSLLSGLPRLSSPSGVLTEAASLAEEKKAEAVSAVVDTRDVPNRDTPLHLAVKLGDEVGAHLLMEAGADWSLQNEPGWSPLQEAICNRQQAVAKIILMHYQPLAWNKWCRRLPRLLGTMRRMRDFYMEITFHFESSVIPFISRIAPSDTYRIWKRGSNLRADMTLAGFDGFKIQRSHQTVLFLGDGTEDGTVPVGTLCILSHADGEIVNALDGAGARPTESETREEVESMSRTSVFRPGIDVTQAILVPQLTWRRQERSEMVGPWRAMVYDMNHVVVTIKSRRVPGGASRDGILSTDRVDKEIDGVLTEDERRRLEDTLGSCSGTRQAGDGEEEKNGWFGGWKRRGAPAAVGQGSGSVGSGSVGSGSVGSDGRSFREVDDGARESEYRKGLRPTIWLSRDFPLRTEELLPLLDILANKVKAIRRLRELLTTKLPSGTFPVKVAIPVVPTVKVVITFTKFEELQPADEFKTPPTSPEADTGEQSISWVNWVRPSEPGNCGGENEPDPFEIPEGYKWVSVQEAKKKKKKKVGKRNGGGGGRQ